MVDTTSADAGRPEDVKSAKTKEEGLQSNNFGRVKAAPVCIDSELKKDAMAAETLRKWVFPADAVLPVVPSSPAVTAGNPALTVIPSSGWSRSSASSAIFLPGSNSWIASGSNFSSNPSPHASSSARPSKAPLSVVSVSSVNSYGDSHAALSSDDLNLDSHQLDHKPGDGSSANNNMKPPPPEEDLNSKVAQRKISRQGRSSQRWHNSSDSVAGQSESSAMIRLVTGCVPILQSGRIMFVSASRKSAWILPKGGWESDEKMEESAVRECFEEAGCLGTLGPALTPVLYETRKAKKRRMEQEAQQNSVKTMKLKDVATPVAEGHTATEEALKHASVSTTVVDTNGEALRKEANGKEKDPMVLSPSNTTITEKSMLVPAMSAETISRLRNSSNHTDETMSVASTLSTTYSQVQMTLFPLYVREIKEEWPEQGRFRRAVPIDEAIAMMDRRPEFRAVLLEVKERGLHLPLDTAPPDRQGEDTISIPAALTATVTTDLASSTKLT